MASSDTMITVSGVKKTFKLPHEKHNSIKSVIINALNTKRNFEKQTVLSDITFEIKKGEFFGIVGRNGSGKSTLMKLIAGIYSPDEGQIHVGGSLTPFIELGVGFNPELTGRENVFLNGALLGFNRHEMEGMYHEIVSFAELGKFMDQKLKNYSSGMQVRLAFSIAIRARSDILLLDEVLAVGDAAFQKKCFDYFRELKKQKKTVVFISHDMNSVREYCERAILIEKGQIVEAGNSEKVAQKYTKLFMEHNVSGATGSDKRWGSGAVTIQSIDIKPNSSYLEVKINCKAKKDVIDPVFGISIFSPIGSKIFESNTKWKKMKTGSFKKNQVIKTVWKVPNIFTNGENYISAGIANAEGLEFYDWWDEAASFRIDKDMVTTALAMPEYEVKINVS